jgi:rhodanese-related sulfurtransferase
MPQTITTGYKALLAQPRLRSETLSVEEARALHGRDDVVFVDLRDPRELEREGRMPEAFHCPRGMLEFWIDPESPYAKPVFSRTSASCSSVPAGCVRHSPPKLRKRWG